MEVLDPVTRPAHAVADEQLKQQVGYSFPCRKAPNAGQVVKRKSEVAGQQPRQLHTDLWIPFIEMRSSYVVGRNDNICQRLHSVGRHFILSGMKSKDCARKRKAQDLPSSIRKESVEKRPTLGELEYFLARLPWSK